MNSKRGDVETKPKTDADWEKIRLGAVTLAEGVSLLKIPRPFAPPGDENNSTGPDPEEHESHAGVHRDMKYYVDTSSRIGLAPVVELHRTDDNTLVSTLERRRSPL